MVKIYVVLRIGLWQGDPSCRHEPAPFTKILGAFSDEGDALKMQDSPRDSRWQGATASEVCEMLLDAEVGR